jgi:hypothetical protein
MAAIATSTVCVSAMAILHKLAREAEQQIHKFKAAPHDGTEAPHAARGAGRSRGPRARPGRNHGYFIEPRQRQSSVMRQRGFRRARPEIGDSDNGLLRKTDEVEPIWEARTAKEPLQSSFRHAVDEDKCLSFINLDRFGAKPRGSVVVVTYHASRSIGHRNLKARCAVAIFKEG